jgi:hypothetical protein
MLAQNTLAEATKAKDLDRTCQMLAGLRDALVVMKEASHFAAEARRTAP